jgi:hypothetical protein
MDGLGQKRSAFFYSGKVAPDARLAATDVIKRRLEACILGKSAMMVKKKKIGVRLNDGSSLVL